MKLLRFPVTTRFHALLLLPLLWSQAQGGPPSPGANPSNEVPTSPNIESNDTATPPLASSDRQKNDVTIRHDGSKADVNAIGHRKIGVRGIGDWYSLDKEIQIGKHYSMMVESGVKLIDDPIVTEYVNRIGQNLVRNSDAQVPFVIKVIDTDEINAMALPGGFFYVNSGLILAADEEAELAGVMAHEIAHVAARHATRQMTRANWINIGSIPLIFVGGGVGYAVRAAAGLMVPVSVLHFQRGFEI